MSRAVSLLLSLLALLSFPPAPAQDPDREAPPPLAVAQDLAAVPEGQGDSASLLAAPGGFTHVVPIVLSASGMNDSYFTTELTFTNRSTAAVEMELGYTAAFASGSGTVRDTVAPRSQKTVRDAIVYLRSLGLPIPEGQSAGGTLRVTFSGLAAPTDAAVSARTTTKVPDGRAGLAYSGVVVGLPSRAYVCGLKQDAKDRSNLALVNLGGPGAGTVNLFVTVYPASASQGLPHSMTVQGLPPGGFMQLTGILETVGFSSGFVSIDKQSGTAPYYAYGVVNDQASSDGSFVPPVLETATLGKKTLVVPAVVESGPFTTELVLSNTAGFPRNLTLTLVADGIAGGSVTTNLTLQGTSQVVIDGIVDWMRQRTSGVPAKGTGVAGALFVAGQTTSDWPSWVVAAARTSAPGAVGRYGLFYHAVANGNALDDAGWIYGLRQDAEDRTNLALINTGETSSSGSDTFAIDVYDGKTGSLAGTLPSVTLGPRQWTQIPMVLNQLPAAVEDAYVKVRRTSGINPFLAYAVINDGAGPGLRSGDGAFLAAQPDCVYTSPSSPAVAGRSGGPYSATVTLKAGCPWVISPSVPWITITFPQEGSGTGTASISYAVARNEDARERNGQIQVGGAALQVIQTANAVSPYDGTWSGTTGQGKTISFVVDRGEVTSITLGMSISLSCGSANGTFTREIPNPSGVYQNEFGTTVYLSTPGTGSPNTIVKGKLSSATQASGSFSVTSITSGSIKCVVTGSYPGSTWTATKQ